MAAPPAQEASTLPQTETSIARECGDCGLCCKLLAVDDIGKPAHQWCAHFAPGARCGIYETRPLACATFQCLWLRQPELGPEWQPRRCHFVVHLDAKLAQMVVTVDPAHPNAWKSEPFHSTFRSWAKRGLAEGLQVVVKIRNRMIAVLPDRDVDLGAVNDGERIKLSRVTTPQGVGLMAEIVRD